MEHVHVENDVFVLPNTGVQKLAFAAWHRHAIARLRQAAKASFCTPVLQLKIIELLLDNEMLDEEPFAVSVSNRHSSFDRLRTNGVPLIAQQL